LLYHQSTTTPQNEDTQTVDLAKKKRRNRCHAMIRHQNADAMVLASALMRGITPLDVRHFDYYQGVNASHKPFTMA
jgi:hypothetical protein